MFWRYRSRPSQSPLCLRTEKMFPGIDACLLFSRNLLEQFQLGINQSAACNNQLTRPCNLPPPSQGYRYLRNHILAAEGYCVVCIDSRGSHNRGTKFEGHIKNRMVSGHGVHRRGACQEREGGLCGRRPVTSWVLSLLVSAVFRESGSNEVDVKCSKSDQAVP